MMTREMEREVEEMCNLSQGVWNEGRMEGHMEGLAKGRMEGIAEGLAKGQIQGRTEGLIEGQSRIVMNMMKMTKRSVQEVMNLLGIDTELRSEVEKRVHIVMSNQME